MGDWNSVLSRFPLLRKYSFDLLRELRIPALSRGLKLFCLLLPSHLACCYWHGIQNVVNANEGGSAESGSSFIYPSYKQVAHYMMFHLIYYARN